LESGSLVKKLNRTKFRIFRSSLGQIRPIDFWHKTPFLEAPNLMLPLDAIGASMHIKGLPCVIGHMHHHVFYVVFLDKDHKFWPSPKKNT
jgi:hypothetical protein